MAEYSHAIYIDESGNGAPIQGIQHYWVTAAVAIPFSEEEVLDLGIKSILERGFRSGEKELKGKHMPNHLFKNVTIDMIVHEIGLLLKRIEAHLWIASAHRGSNVPHDFKLKNPLPKDITRQNILEMINDFLNIGHHSPNHFLLIWDISDEQELEDFSRNISTFRYANTNDPLNSRLAPAILGGLSHDWNGLQVADIIAHCALHKCGKLNRMPDANNIKANGFSKYIEPLLQKDIDGKTIGWRIL